LRYSRHSISQPRNFARILEFRVFRFLLFAVLAAGVVIAPARMAAWDSASAASSQPAAAASETARPEAAQSEEEQQTNAFRLEGPVVKWTARTFNLQPGTAANIFDFINFAIIVLGIGIPLFKFLPKFLRQRGEKVRTDIESARKVTEDANSRLSAVEAKLSRIDEEIQKFRTEVEEEIGRDEARIKASLEEESARIVAAAQQEIGSAAAQAKRGLRHFAADLAVEQAAKQMVLTPATDRALIAEFVGDVNKGGRN
jgi:F-type H+-transporting ATPase subunit b